MEPASGIAAVSVIVAVSGAAAEAFAFAGTVETNDASFADSASFDGPAAALAAVMNLNLLAWN